MGVNINGNGQFVDYFCYQSSLGSFEGHSAKNKISEEEAVRLAGRPLRSNKEAVLLSDSLIVHYDSDYQGNSMYFRLRKVK